MGPGTWTPKRKLALIEDVRETGNITHSCQRLGLNRTRCYQLKHTDSQFAQALEDAREEAIDMMIAEARRRAVEGVTDPVYQQGQRVGEIQKYSDNLLMFLIKGARPEYATERRELSGRDGGPIETSQMTEAQLDERLALLLGKDGAGEAPGREGATEEATEN